MHASAPLVMNRRRAVMGNGAERPTDRLRHRRRRRHRRLSHRSRDSHRRHHLHSHHSRDSHRRRHLLLRFLHIRVQASELA